MLHACPKLDYLPRIDEVFMLNLSLRKVKQETTTPQIALYFLQEP